MTIKSSFSRQVTCAIFNYMNSLDTKETFWVVDPHSFLPANVCCDFHGQAKFLDSLEKIVKQTMADYGIKDNEQ